MTRSQFFPLMLLLLLANPFSTGALRTSSLVMAAVPPGSLSIGFLESVDSLNPFLGTREPSRILSGLLYDFLFSEDQDGQLVPNLAVAAAADSSGANWTYQIRQGVTWSDGSPFTAEDVNFTINYNIADFNALYTYEPYLNHVVPCTGSTVFCGARVSSPWNVTVYFDRPYVAGKAIFVPILQKAQWETIPLTDAQTAEVNCAPYPNAKLPIGTGPFIADPNICGERAHSQPIEIHRNPTYHPVGTHVGLVNITDVFLKPFADENTLALALKTGDIDVAEFTAAAYDAFAGQPNIQRTQGLLCTQDSNEIGISQYDNSSLNPARYDQNVRRAMAMATNKDDILATIYAGRGVRGADLISPVTPPWFFDPTKTPGVTLTYNLTGANVLLDQAGYSAHWTDSTGAQYRMAAHDIRVVKANGTPVTIPAGTHLEFTMDVPQESLEDQMTARYLTAQWALVGIKLDVTVKLEPSLSLDVYGGNVDTYIWHQSGDPDPNYLLSLQSRFTLNGWNDNYWNNASYTRLYTMQLADFDPQRRHADVLAAQELHYNSSVYIVTVYPYGEWAWRTDRWQGWGDWNAHPFRQLGARWGANPLVFGLTPATWSPSPWVAITSPSAGAVLTSAAVTVTWKAFDNGSQIGRYDLSVDGGPPEDMKLNTSFRLALSDRFHTVAVRVFDVGGTNASDSVYFRIDTNPFSLSGPFAGAPTYASVLVAAVAVALFALLRRRKKATALPPSAPNNEGSQGPPP